jgi:hypothetical protein
MSIPQRVPDIYHLYLITHISELRRSPNIGPLSENVKFKPAELETSLQLTCTASATLTHHAHSE